MRRRVRLLGVALVGILTAVLGLPLAFGGSMMWTLTHPGCSSGPSPDQYGLKFQSIEFTTPRGYRLRGFFMPGDSGATVIVVPTMGNDRGANLDSAAIFNQAGFNTLTFDAGTCDGAAFHSLGYAEADDVVAAYGYLRGRGDVDTLRVSLHGFSSAGATSLFAAARIPQIRAVSVEGNYDNFADQLGLGDGGSPLEVLVRAGAEMDYRLVTGLDVRQLDPLGVVSAISPRPILLIYGSREVSLPGAREMLARSQASGGQAQLWVVDGAGHGGYRVAAGTTAYAERLVAFHRAASAGDTGS